MFKVMFSGEVEMPYSTSIRRGLKLNTFPNGKIIIGANVFFNYNCSISCAKQIKIGNHSIFGENVKMYDHNHRFNDSARPIIEQGFTMGTISIGHNCWIGSNVVILKDVTIGNNVVIGAGSVIEESIPDNTMVRMDSKLTSEKIIMQSPKRIKDPHTLLS